MTKNNNLKVNQYFFLIFKSFTILLFILFNYSHIFSQNEYSSKRSLFLKDTILAEKYNVIANSLYNNNIIDSSINFYYKSNQVYQNIIDSLNNIIPSNQSQFIIDQKLIVEKQILCFDGIIYILIYQNKLDSSLKLINRALNYGLKYVDSTNTKIALLINELGNYYQIKGDNEKSIENFELSLKLLFKNQSYNDQYASNIYNNIGLTLLYKGEYDKGIEYLSKDLALKKNKPVTDHTDLGITYGNLGLAYWYKGDLDLSLDYFYQQISLFMKTLNPEHHWFSVIYHNLGNIYSDKKDWVKSMEFHKKALSIKLKNFDYYNPDVSLSYGGIASVFADQELYDSALVYSLKDLEISKKVYDNEHIFLPSSFYNVGKCYMELNNTIKAKQFFDTTYTILAGSNNKFHPFNGLLYQTFAEIYLNQIDSLINNIDTINNKTKKLLLNNTDTILGYYQLALDVLINDFSCLTNERINTAEKTPNYIKLYALNIDLYKHPELKTGYSNFIEGVNDLTKLQEILELKGEMFEKKWKFSNK